MTSHRFRDPQAQRLHAAVRPVARGLAAALVVLLVTGALAQPATVPAERGGSSVPTASVTERAAVNPLTGQPLAFEATQRRLEQMRLETQLLEEEAKQANLRNGMSLAPIRRSNEERRLQAEMFGPLPGPAGAAAAGGAAGGATGGATGLSPVPPRPQPQPMRRAQGQASPPTLPGLAAGASPVTAAGAAATAASGTGEAAAAQVLAILRSGERRRAIVQIGATTASVAEGDMLAGRRIGVITDGAVSIDGVAVDLPRSPAVVAAIDRRPVGLAAPAGARGLASPAAAPPAAAFARAGPAPASPVPAGTAAFPPLPVLPVIGPVEPDNPLSALGPQGSARPAITLPPLQRPASAGAGAAPSTGVPAGTGVGVAPLPGAAVGRGVQP